ncbi:MAG: VWA domain-containing protein [Burkholderiales bacterium]|jgi:Ca-activated chloride channel family protein
MSFLWPQMLWLLALLPASVAAYVWLLRRRKAAVGFASLALVREALGPGQRVRRHVPPALFLLAIAAALVAIARPTAVITLPSQFQTIVLAIDVSLSMRANDVQPDRITAAQAAAKAFIEDHPPRARIGIVSFGGSAQLVQKPTDRSDELIAAIDRFQLQRGTATGSALVVALATLFPDDDIDVESVVFGRQGSQRGQAIDAPREGARKERPAPVKPGSYPSGVIVLLSDGRRTTGPDPIEVAKMAADRGVRVFTVGFGTVEGATIGFEGWSAYVRLDEETLKAVAEMTRGEYYHAGTAQDLKKVYQELNTRFVMERKDTEVTSLFSAAAAILAALAGALSIAWFGRFA